MTAAAHVRRMAEMGQMFDDISAAASDRRELAELRATRRKNEAEIARLRDALADANTLIDAQRQRIEDLSCEVLSAKGRVMA